MSTPLGVACTAGDTLLVIDLLGSGHSADEPVDPIGRTPLMVASSLEVVDVLLEAGASLDPTSFGADALQVVVSGDQSALGSPAERIRAARSMLEHGASFDRRNEHGWSRLYSAAFADDLEAVDALLAAGADPDRRDDRSRRAVDHALDSERRLTELLETAAADTSDAIRTSRDSARACVVRLTST